MIEGARHRAFAGANLRSEADDGREPSRNGRLMQIVGYVQPERGLERAFDSLRPVAEEMALREHLGRLGCLRHECVAGRARGARAARIVSPCGARGESLRTYVVADLSE